jgi:hypothetical protein
MSGLDYPAIDRDAMPYVKKVTLTVENADDTTTTYTLEPHDVERGLKFGGSISLPEMPMDLEFRSVLRPVSGRDTIGLKMEFWGAGFALSAETTK